MCCGCRRSARRSSTHYSAARPSTGAPAAPDYSFDRAHRATYALLCQSRSLRRPGALPRPPHRFCSTQERNQNHWRRLPPGPTVTTITAAPPGRRLCRRLPSQRLQPPQPSAKAVCQGHGQLPSLARLPLSRWPEGCCGSRRAVSVGEQGLHLPLPVLSTWALCIMPASRLLTDCAGQTLPHAATRTPSWRC